MANNLLPVIEASTGGIRELDPALVSQGKLVTHEDHPRISLTYGEEEIIILDSRESFVAKLMFCYPYSPMIPFFSPSREIGAMRQSLAITTFGLGWSEEHSLALYALIKEEVKELKIRNTAPTLPRMLK